jgi:transcriptional regulator with GAF, ATPase, and Fis domain
MKIPAVKFAASEPRPTFHATELDLASPANLIALRGEGLPAVYVIQSPRLAGLRELKPLIIDRGRKNKATQLGKSLLGRDKPVLIDGEFKSVVQLKRSVNALLANARKQGDHNLYFIGAPVALFEDLHRQAQARVADDRPRRVFTGQSLLDHLRQEPVPAEIAKRYVGQSERIELVRHLIVCAGRVDEPALIVGETGTGKEIVARLIHEQSDRKTESFVPVNCAAIPTGLFESELFGHIRGAFTGAVGSKQGLWSFATKGTLFLDEIGDLDLTQQAKILRAIDSGEFRPVGGRKSHTSQADRKSVV